MDHLRYDTSASYMPLINNIMVDDINYEVFEENDYTDTYLIKVYQYFINKGYKNIILKQIVNLINTIFLVLFTLFLFNCIDFYKLVHLDTYTHLSNIVSWDAFLGNAFSVLCFIILIGFIILKIVKIRSSSRNYRIMKDFYNITLNIDDTELLLLDWNDIVKKMSETTDKINEYVVAKKIMRKENYIIALMSNNIIKNIYLTRLIEWNLIYYVINHFFKYNGLLKNELFENKYELVDNIKRRLKIMAFIYLVFMPFIFIFLTFQSIFKYGERFYNNPELLAGRQWNISSLWSFREYNELEHFFKKRLRNSKKYTNNYISQFNSKITDTISRSFIFILSAFIIILVLLSLINENILLKLYISEDRTTLWYIGIFGSLLTFLKSFVVKNKNNDPKNTMKEISTCLRHIPNHWLVDAKQQYVKDEIVKKYEYKIIIILKECIGVILIPYILYNFRDYIDTIANYIINYTIEDPYLGKICCYSHFNKKNNPSPKLESSLIYFQINHPDWIYEDTLEPIDSNTLVL